MMNCLDPTSLVGLVFVFIANEPTLLPKVRDSQKKTFEKCVDYYFPGKASMLIMG